MSIDNKATTQTAPLGGSREESDLAELTRGRDAPGSRIGAFVQSPPLLFTRDGHAIYLGDIYRGRAAFLIGGGASFNSIDHRVLSKPGCLTMGMNNSPKTYRPDLWICVDNPPRFLKSIWLDPGIMKFVPYCFFDHPIFDNEAWRIMDTKTGDCPNVLYYRRNACFNAENFLVEDTVNWGDSNQTGGHRSVMLAALRILFFLGIRDVFLLGVDFKMDADHKYHFDENRSAKSIEWNNETYGRLAEKFELLQPVFKANGFRIHNCNPGSDLKVFPFIDLDDAVAICGKDLPNELANERSEGLYERDPLQRLSPPKVLIPEEDPPGTGPADQPAGIGRQGVVVGLDSKVEWLLPWWHEQYAAQNKFPITFVDFGMSPESRLWCRKHGHLVDLPAGLPAMEKKWFYKAWMFRLCEFDKIVGMDLDCEVRGSLQPVFDLIDDKFVLARDNPIGEYQKVFIPGVFFNSGVIGVSRDNPLLEQWENESLVKHPFFRSDQEILNFVLYSGGIEVVALPERYNRLRLNGDHADAVVMHWTGPEGKQIIKAKIEALREG